MVNFWENDPVVNSASTSPVNFWENDPVVNSASLNKQEIAPTNNEKTLSLSGNPFLPHFMQSEKASPNEMNPLMATVAGIDSAIPFSDEIGSVIEAPFRAGYDAWKGKGFDLGRGYNEAMQNYAHQFKKAEQDHPVFNFAGNVGGTLATLPVGDAAVGTAAKFAPETVNTAKTFLEARPLMESMATGAGYGALQGAGEGRGKERFGNALTGAAAGAAGGAAFHGLGKAGDAAYNKLFRGPEGSIPGLSKKTNEALKNELDITGKFQQEAGKNLIDAGEDAMTADLSPQAANLLDMATQRSGKGLGMASERLEARNAKATSDINKAIDDAFGKVDPATSEPGVFTVKTGIRKATAPTLQKAYEEAYKQPIDYTSEDGKKLIDFFINRMPKEAITYANKMMRTAGIKPNQYLARISNEDGQRFVNVPSNAVVNINDKIDIKKLPNVQQLDYITQSLSDYVNSKTGKGELGGLTRMGNAYHGLLKETRDIMKKHIPQYGQALTKSGDAIRASHAFDVGNKIFRRDIGSREFAEKIFDYSPAEQESLHQGIRNRIDNVLSNVKRTITDDDVASREAIAALKELSSNENKEKITSAIGPLKAGVLFNKLDKAAKNFNLKARLSQNSKTYQRQALDKRLSGKTDWGDINYLAFTHPGSAIGEGFRLGRKKLQKNQGNKMDKVYAELADYLTRPGQETLPQINTLFNPPASQNISHFASWRPNAIQAITRMTVPWFSKDYN